MSWIPGGALVAGTPTDALPRIADQEMPGEQVILQGYYIDVFPYPNEEGAIPLTNVTRDEAEALCKREDKRLCTELEWERACKGPNNLSYEYGTEYRPDRCKTGAQPKLRPSGLLIGCVSDFKVRDLHGGVWEWTSSDWGRGSEREAYSTRGGNGIDGELIGRCANARPESKDARSGTLGFRCCAGPENEAKVTLSVARGSKLVTRERDRALAAKIVAALPGDTVAELGSNGPGFSVERLWTWRPSGNEDLVVAAGCSGIGIAPRCGVIVARTTLADVRVLVWAESGFHLASVHIDKNPRELWLLGGDTRGAFRRRIAYSWGRVTVDEKERRVPGRPVKKKK
jgi:formylglycine-generating enzyme